MKKSELQSMVAEAVRKGVASAMTESTKGPKVKKITRTQLAEGVRKALRMAIKESVGMPGGAMPPPGAAPGGATGAPTSEASNVISGGTVPSPEELQHALDAAGGWDMDLQGQDSIAFDYAMLVAGLGSTPDMDSGHGMHAVLTALTHCPSPSELPNSMDDEEIQNPHSQLNQLLDRWDARYHDPIEQAAESLASSILSALGTETV